MKEEKEFIYLKGTEELGEIIDFVKDHEAKEIVLVIPRNTKSLLYPTNLEILKNEIHKARKKIYFNTEDERILSLAKQVGIDIFLEDFTYEEATRIVTDILPPQKTKPKIIIKKEIPQKKKSSKKLILVGIIIALIVFGTLIFIANAFSSAIVEVTLKKQKMNFEEILLLNPQLTQPDFEKLSLPAETIEIVKNHTVKQETTGTKIGKAKATGKVQLTNLDNSNSISIIQGTRIKSSKNYIYRTLERVYLEPQQSKEVVVVADDVGEEYQIEDLSENFTIPGLKGTYWEDKIQVKLIEPIIYSPEAKIVTIDDINQGKIKLENEIKALIQNELKTKYKDYVIPEDINLVDFKVADIYPPVGKPSKEVILTGSGKLVTLGVRKNQLIDFLKDLIAKENLKNNANVSIKGLKINSIKSQNFDLKNKIATILIEGEVEIESNLDVNQLTKELAGEDIANLKKIINKYESIEKASITLKPFWLNRLPLDPSKITIKIKWGRIKRFWWKMDKPIYVEVLETIVKNLVNNPDEVKITKSLDELGVLLKIKVHPQDMGLLIGRKGAIINAIKTIMKAIGVKNHARLNIKVEEPEPIFRVKTKTEEIIEELKEEK